jgi:hypothetical protein
MRNLFEASALPLRCSNKGRQVAPKTRDHMPASHSRIVRECHRYSAQADAIAASASDEQTKAAFLEIATRWLDIALTYESGEQSIRLRKKRWQG